MGVSLNKENRLKVKAIRTKIISLCDTAFSYIRGGKTESTNDLKTVIKLCKEIEEECNKLAPFGFKSEIPSPRLRYQIWEDKLNNKKQIKKENKKVKVKCKNQSTNTNDICTTNLYYIMLCWTAKQDFFVCDNIVNTIRSYFEKLKLEFMDTQSDKFPDRTEFVSTYKIKTTQEAFDIIMNSTEFIIDNNTTSIHEKCNVGVFGKKIE
jgi:hypothetical protein